MFAEAIPFAIVEPAPTDPTDWEALDTLIVKHLLPRGDAGAPYEGVQTCQCGGTWRYVLGGDAEDPIWRCLHCGSLFSGKTPVRWD